MGGNVQRGAVTGGSLSGTGRLGKIDSGGRLVGGDTKSSSGRSTSTYPDGRVVDNRTGEVISQGSGGYGSGGGGGSMGYDPYLESIGKASKVTQERAAADKEAALGELKGTREAALGEFANVPEDMISEAIAGKMYSSQRDVIEGQKSANLRNVQRSFYGGGSAPSGAMLEASMSAERGATGQMSKAKSDIDINRATKNWESRFGLAREKAGIRTDIAPEMVDVYGNTIAEVPEYSQSMYGGGGAANIMASGNGRGSGDTSTGAYQGTTGASIKPFTLPSTKDKKLIAGGKGTGYTPSSGSRQLVAGGKY